MNPIKIHGSENFVENLVESNEKLTLDSPFKLEIKNSPILEDLENENGILKD